MVAQFQDRNKLLKNSNNKNNLIQKLTNLKSEMMSIHVVFVGDMIKSLMRNP